MIPAAELNAIRDEAERTLSSVCNIVTVGRTRDARGQVTEVTVTGPDFPCAVDPIDIANEAVIAARLGTATGWRIAMPLTVIISENDRIGFDVEGDVRIVEVVGAEGPQSDAPLRVVLAAEST